MRAADPPPPAMPLIPPDQEPRDDPFWPRGSVAYERIPQRLFEHLIARVLQLSPESAPTLLSVSKQFFAATARALYEEVELADDEAQLSRPPRNTQAEALLRHPENYARYVRKLTIGPRSLQAAHCDDAEEREASYFSFSPFSSSRPLGAEATLRVLELLPNLATFVWASDRVPRSDLCQLLARATPELPFLAIRPEPSNRHHGGAVQAPFGSPSTPSKEGPGGLLPSPDSDESGDSGGTPLGPPRWDAQNLHLLPRLRELNLSHISLDGSRYLASALTTVRSLRLLKLDFGFVDDLLLEAIGANCKSLEELSLRTSGTKLTGKGLAQALSGCHRLRALTLTEVEGRLGKATWSNLKKVPSQLRSLRVAFNEVGHRHSWSCDQIESLFDVLKLTATQDGQSYLTTLAVSRIVPTTMGEGKLEEGFSALGLSYGGPGAPERAEACDSLVFPRALPKGALELLHKHGRNLRTLDLTFFALSIAEVRVVVSACPKLESLGLLIEASFSDLLGLHSAFVGLHHLAELNVSLLEAYSAPPQLTTRQGNAPSTPARRRGGSTTAAELSPASSTLSTLSDSEPRTPETPILPPGGRRSSKKQSPGSLDQPLHSKELHIPTARDVRKFARGLSNLRVVRWTGRGAKGEWHLGAEGHGTRSVDFQDGSKAAASLSRAAWTHDALEVDTEARRAHGYDGLGAARCEGTSTSSGGSEGPRDEGMSTEESDEGSEVARRTSNRGKGRSVKGAQSDTRPQPSIGSPPLSHGKAASVASSRRSASERTSPTQSARRASTSVGKGPGTSRSAPLQQLQRTTGASTFSKSPSSRGKAWPASASSERQGIIRRANDDVGTIIIGRGRGTAAASPSDDGSAKGNSRGPRTRSKRKKKAEGQEQQTAERQGQAQAARVAAKGGGDETTSGSSSPSVSARRGAQGASKDKDNKAAESEWRSVTGRGAGPAGQEAAAGGSGIWGRTAPSSLPTPGSGAGLPRRPDV